MKKTASPLSDFSSAAQPVGYVPLDREEEKALIRAYQEKRCLAAANKLLKSYERFLWKQIDKYAKSVRVDREDLFQEANIGFIEAIERFDLEKDFRLATYARWWILARVRDYKIKNAVIQHRPHTLGPVLTKAIKDYGQALADHARETGNRPMSMKESAALGERLGMPIDQIREAIASAYGESISLDAPLSSDLPNGMSRLDFLKEDGATALEHAEALSDKTYLEKLISRANLTPREEFVLRARNLAADGEVCTLETLGAKFDITRERIRQIEEKALRKLRKAAFDPSAPLSHWADDARRAAIT